MPSELETIAQLIGTSEMEVRVRDNSERTPEEQALEQYAVRLQALSRRLVEVQEEERRRLARALHDDICQIPTCVTFAFEVAAAAPPQTASVKMAKVRALLDEALTQVRGLSSQLQPPLLDHMGLLPALCWLIERNTGSTRVQVNFRHAGLDRRFAPLVEITAYRLVQEALTNIARHAQVHEAAVRVWADAATLQVQVEDQGVGFDLEAVPAAGCSGGLQGMKERVLLLGGKWIVTSTPGDGTHVLAELPLGGPPGGEDR